MDHQLNILSVRLKIFSMAAESRTSVAICRKRGRDATSWLVFQLTEASGPKKYSRMLLSMPTTSKPWRWKNFTASLPISPDEPVTITKLKPKTFSSVHALTQDTCEADFVRANPFSDIADNLLWRSQRLPIEQSGHLRMIGNVPRNVDRIGLKGLQQLLLSPDDFLTKTSEFLQRDRATAAPSHVEGASRHQIPRLELPPYKIAKIVGMKQIANLKSLAAKSRVFQRDVQNNDVQPTT